MNRPLVSAVVGEAAAQAGMEASELLQYYRTGDQKAAARRAMWALRILRPDLSYGVLGVWFDRTVNGVARSVYQAKALRARDPFERREMDMLLAAFTEGGEHAQAA